uniref:Uncharacterized protein n=1 Tax=Arundo donax TaxID=35708 RepID=A0A0A9AB80_ARUDO
MFNHRKRVLMDTYNQCKFFPSNMLIKDILLYNNNSILIFRQLQGGLF